jgi:transposase-like protein
MTSAKIEIQDMSKSVPIHFIDELIEDEIYNLIGLYNDDRNSMNGVKLEWDSKELYSMFKNYCQENGISLLSNNLFGRHLGKYDILTKKHTKRGYTYSYIIC